VCADDEKEIYATKWAGDTVYSSLDGGNTWHTTTIDLSAMTLTRASDGMLYIVSNIQKPGVVYSSADSGATWREQAGLVGQDCWSIVANNCDPAKLYVTTENFNGNPWVSCLWASTDRGATWTSGFSDPREVAGSVATFGNAAIAGTITQGMLRSTDDGVSWQTSSGGANGAEDNRGICMVNENIAFALDRQGNIWGTFNGGGDSIPVTISGSLTTTAPTLFQGDTLFCDRFSRSVFFNRSGCAPPSVSRCSIVGADSASYQMGILTYDSIVVTLHQPTLGAQRAQLIFTLNDGSSDTVTLAGVVVQPIPNSLSASPATLFQFDTMDCDSITRSIFFSRSGCSPPSVSSWSITGKDSSSFVASDLSYDSISVTLRGSKRGAQEAQLVLNLDDSSRDTIALAGFITASANLLSASPATVFQTDTISCDSLTRTIRFNRSGCTPPSISEWSLIGEDSASFEAGNFSYDSILVTLLGIKQGEQHAKLVLALDNGSGDTVSLAGFVNLVPNSVTLSTSDMKTNTLGGIVAVPITVSGLLHPEEVELALHYDGTMDYLGSFSPSGAKLDVAGNEWPGRAMIRISGAAPGMIAGYAKFNVFNDSNRDAHARFDSLNVLTTISPCEYSDSGASATSTITAPSGCGTPILSQLIHLGTAPVFKASPNPSGGNVWITSSDNIGAVTIAIYDMLGTERSRLAATMQKNNPIPVRLPEANGVYTIVLTGPIGAEAIRVVRKQ